MARSNWLVNLNLKKDPDERTDGLTPSLPESRVSAKKTVNQLKNPVDNLELYNKIGTFVFLYLFVHKNQDIRKIGCKYPKS